MVIFGNLYPRSPASHFHNLIQMHLDLLIYKQKYWSHFPDEEIRLGKMKLFTVLCSCSVCEFARPCPKTRFFSLLIL